MSILQNIFSKIIPSSFGNVVGNIKDKVENAAKATKDAVTNHPNESNQANQSNQPQSSTNQNQNNQTNSSNQTPHIDVVSILDGLAKNNPQKLNWRTSIVDMLKLLGLDSSLEARKKLAAELHYQGNTSDSATMNTWLHKEVMKKIAEKGGNVKDLF